MTDVTLKLFGLIYIYKPGGMWKFLCDSAANSEAKNSF